MHNNVITGLNCGDANAEPVVGRTTRREGSLEIYSGHHDRRIVSVHLRVRRAARMSKCRSVERISVSVIRHRKEAVGYGFA